MKIIVKKFSGLRYAWIICVTLKKAMKSTDEHLKYFSGISICLPELQNVSRDCRKATFFDFTGPNGHFSPNPTLRHPGMHAEGPVYALCYGLSGRSSF